MAFPERPRLVQAPGAIVTEGSPEIQPSRRVSLTRQRTSWPLGEQRLHEVAPDEPGASGHQNPHATSSTPSGFS